MSKVLVVGDIMVDQYIFVETNRTAPEARIPVWDEKRKETRPGGAANVARNLRALGDIEVSLAGLTDFVSQEMIGYHDIDVSMCTGNQTMYKRRYIGPDGEHLFRHDNFLKFKADVPYFAERLKRDLSDQYEIVVISDYDKGTVTDEVVDVIRSVHKGPVVVDSKRHDLRIFSGFTILKVNEHEYDVQLSSPYYSHVESLFDYVVVTKGARGAELRQRDPIKDNDIRYVIHSEKFAISPVKAKDVTGCGDTHTAAMAFSLMQNPDMRQAVKFANHCAREVVQKFGTSVPNKV